MRIIGRFFIVVKFIIPVRWNCMTKSCKYGLLKKATQHEMHIT